MQIFNELVTMLAVYFLCLYAGDLIQDNNMKEGLGRSMVVMVLFNFFVTIIVASFGCCYAIRQKCNKRKNDNKIEK